MSSRRPSCIVLGGGGFIGTNLCKRLVASEFPVRAFGHGRRFPEELRGVDWYEGDFGDTAAVAAAVASCEVVFHLIGTTPQSASIDMIDDLQKYVIPSLALMDICRRFGVGRVVFVSSGGTVYGKPRGVPTSETAATDPIAAYGISKLAVEKYLALYEHLHGLDYRVLRVTNPFGPFQIPATNQGIVAAVVSRTLSNERVEIWGDGSVVRDFIFVDDVVDALVAAAIDAGSARIFNIGTGEGRTVLDVISAVERLLGRRVQIDINPGRHLDVPVSVVAIEQAKNLLGWAPKTTFEAGLQTTIDWWRMRPNRDAQ